MTRFINPLFFNNLIDANIMDEVADGQNGDVEEIVRLQQNGTVRVLLPHSVQAELQDAPVHVRRVANTFIFTIPVTLTYGELARYRELVTYAKGDAEEKNIAPDLFHVMEAAKYGGYFITRDKRLLKRRDKIAEKLQVEVVTPSEFLHKVAQAQEMGHSRPFADRRS